MFSSLEAADIIPTETSRPGVSVLKHYLNYASSGRLPDAGVPTGREPDSDFEVFVAERLRRHIMSARPRVAT